MQIPGPTSKRRSISAVSARSFHHSILIFLCGAFAACSWLSALADQPPKPPNPFKVLDHRSGEVSTIVFLEDGDIGAVDLDEIANDDPSSIVELLQRHSQWTGARDDLDLVLTSASERRVFFMQRIQGALVGYDGFVDFDASGRVTRLRSAIVKPEAVEDWPTILEADAVAVATSELRNHLGTSDSDVRIPVDSDNPVLRPAAVEPRLMLRLRGSDEQPEFFWNMIMVATGESGWYIVRVNAHSAEVRITPISRSES